MPVWQSTLHHVEEKRNLAGARLARNAVVHDRRNVLGKDIDSQYQVAAFEEGKSLTLQVAPGGPVSFQMTWDLQPLDEGADLGVGRPRLRPQARRGRARLVGWAVGVKDGNHTFGRPCQQAELTPSRSGLKLLSSANPSPRPRPARAVALFARTCARCKNPTHTLGNQTFGDKGRR